jgi:hypothetical protein
MKQDEMQSIGPENQEQNILNLNPISFEKSKENLANLKKLTHQIISVIFQF